MFTDEGKRKGEGGKFGYLGEEGEVPEKGARLRRSAGDGLVENESASSEREGRSVDSVERVEVDDGSGRVERLERRSSERLVEAHAVRVGAAHGREVLLLVSAKAEATGSVAASVLRGERGQTPAR